MKKASKSLMCFCGLHSAKEECATYGREGARFMNLVRSDLEEMECCHRVCLPGVGVRLWMARKINELVRAAQKKALLEAADRLVNRTSAARLRRIAREIKVQAPRPPKVKST